MEWKLQWIGLAMLIRFSFHLNFTIKASIPSKLFFPLKLVITLTNQMTDDFNLFENENATEFQK